MNIPMRPVPDREQGAATHGQHVRVLRQLFLQRRDLVGIQPIERNRVPVIVTQRFILEIIDLSEKHDGEKSNPQKIVSWATIRISSNPVTSGKRQSCFQSGRVEFSADMSVSNSPDASGKQQEDEQEDR